MLNFFQQNIFVNEIFFNSTDNSSIIEFAFDDHLNISQYQLVVLDMERNWTFLDLAEDEVVDLADAVIGESEGGLTFATVEVFLGMFFILSVTTKPTVLQFVSWNTNITAMDGLAEGEMSVDVGAAGTGESLQLQGTGYVSDDFEFEAISPPTPGAFNGDGQTILDCLE